MYKVLIAENDPMVAMIEEQYISQNPNFCVHGVCRNGKDVMSFLKRERIDLVIMDLLLPEADGIALFKQIRSENMPVSVIVVTAVKNSRVIEDVLRLGAEDYLIKPFENSRFQRALGEFCRRHDTFAAAEEIEQDWLDRLIVRGDIQEEHILPKGMQKKTMERIYLFLQNNFDRKFSGERIAEGVGLSRITVQRYLNHLCDSGKIARDVYYETGGRPCMLYHWNV